MISITILKDQSHYRGITCIGHAGYEKAGKDIVCSAVSMLVINTINGIDQFTEDAIHLIPKTMMQHLRKKDSFLQKQNQTI